MTRVGSVVSWKAGTVEKRQKCDLESKGSSLTELNVSLFVISVMLFFEILSGQW